MLRIKVAELAWLKNAPERVFVCNDIFYSWNIDDVTANRMMNHSFVSQLTNGRRVITISFLWGLAEGVFFFMIPDVYITFILLFKRKMGMLAFAAAIAGSIVSAILLFAVLMMTEFRFYDYLVFIPGISHGMLTAIMQQLQVGGLPSLADIPFGGVPYKVYTTSAALSGISLVEYIIWSVPARALRMLLPISIALLFSYILQRSIHRHTKFWIALFVMVWALFYLWYFIAIGKAY